MVDFFNIYRIKFHNHDFGNIFQNQMIDWDNITLVVNGEKNRPEYGHPSPEM